MLLRGCKVLAQAQNDVGEHAERRVLRAALNRFGRRELRRLIGDRKGLTLVVFRYDGHRLLPSHPCEHCARALLTTRAPNGKCVRILHS